MAPIPQNAVAVLSAAIAAIAMAWSAASAEPVRRELLAPPLSEELRAWSTTALHPPQQWPPPRLPAPGCSCSCTGQPPAGALATIDLNQASAEALQQLPGIGPQKAERILEYRDRHGPFQRVLDLRRVGGFGRRTVNRLLPRLTVQPIPTHQKKTTHQED